MRKWLAFWGVGVAAAGLIVGTGPARSDEATERAEEVAVVGALDDGSPIESRMGKEELRGRMRSLIAIAHDSSVAALRDRDWKPGKWKLRTVVVGIGVNAEVGVGPIVKVSTVPRFRIAFADSDDPIVP